MSRRRREYEGVIRKLESSRTSLARASRRPRNEESSGDIAMLLSRIDNLIETLNLLLGQEAAPMDGPMDDEFAERRRRRAESLRSRRVGRSGRLRSERRDVSRISSERRGVSGLRRRRR